MINDNRQQIIDFYDESGALECFHKAPQNRYQTIKKTAPSNKPINTTKKNPSPKVENIPSAQKNAEETSSQANTLEELKQQINSFEGCSLKKTATNLVFCDGIESSEIMFIGEAPGADEDRQGLPFVGRSGQLLDKVIHSIGLSRKKNIYITNIIPWRPPGNRPPTSSEMAMFMPFIHKHVELFNPKIIVLLGGTAVKTLLGRNEGIMKLRGRWHEGPHKIPTLPTFHPAYLLRSPGQKKYTWHDLLMIKDKIEELNVKV